MGQRHQVYLFLKDDKGFTHGVGIHHQWLYGISAVRKAIQVLTFQKRSKAEKYNPINQVYFERLENTTQALLALYQVNMDEGHFNTSAHFIGLKPCDEDEKALVADPRKGDNNDGATVFDFTDPKHPTYCMINVFEHSPEDVGSVGCLPQFVAKDFEAYIRAYYPVNGTKYQRGRFDKKWFATNEKEIAKVLKKAAKFKVMTQARLEELFPAVFKAEKKVA